MKYAVDEVIESIVILQNLSTKEMLEINLDSLEFEVQDGDILVNIKGRFLKDSDYKKKRLERIREKLNRLKK